MDGSSGASRRHKRDLTPGATRDASIGQGDPRPQDLTGAELTKYAAEQERWARLQSNVTWSDVIRQQRSLTADVGKELRSLRSALTEIGKPLAWFEPLQLDLPQIEPPQIEPPDADWEIEKHAIAYERALRRVAGDAAAAAAADTDELPHAGGAPTQGVMRKADAERLETVLDARLRNGHDPNISGLAGRFGVSRDRIRQAILMRRKDISLHDPETGSAQFHTVLDSTGNVHWPSTEKLRKS